MRAMAAFIFELGTETEACPASRPLRMRVSKSAIGSVTLIDYPSPRLPRRLGHAGEVPLQGLFPEADAAQLEPADVAARAAAHPAAVAHLDLVLAAGFANHNRRFGHLLAFPEGHAQQLEQAPRLGIVRRRRYHRHFEAADLVDLVVDDLREDQLFPNSERVVAAPVETVGRNATEVSRPRQGDVHQAVVERPHALAAQRNL